MSAPATAGPSVIVPTNSVDEALGVLFTLGAGALHAQRCSLYLRMNEGSQLRLIHEIGLPMREKATSIPASGTIAGLVVRTRVPLLVADIAAYPALPVHPDRYASQSFISVPILVENDALGVLNIAEREDGRPFTEDDLHSAEMVSRSIATVLHSDLLAQRALAETDVDPVTGLYNSRHFAKRLKQEVERAQRARLPLTLLLLDVEAYADVAKRVDTQTAGLLMRSVGQMVAETVRQSDVLARRTDNEIAVLLPSTPLDKARRVARTISREVLHEKLPPALRYDCEDLKVAIGVASLGPAADADALLRAAEDALVQAHSHADSAAVVVADEPSGASRRNHLQRTNQDAIATALRLGIPYLSDPADASTPAAVRLLSRHAARAYASFPVAYESGTLTLAMADPTDAGAIQAVSDLTHMAVYPVASPREKILQAIATLMSEPPEEIDTRVRIHIPSTADRHLFARQASDVAAACDHLNALELTIEGTVTVEPSVDISPAALVLGLATNGTVTLTRDGADPRLLHVGAKPAGE